jgi:putative aldouronate transport system permease protein
VKRTRAIRSSAADRAFDALNVTIIVLVTASVLYPLLYVISASFSSVNAVMSRRVWLWPVEPTIVSYKAMFEHRLLTRGYLNSFFYMTAGTAINLFVLILASYPLSRKDLPARGFFTFLFVFTMFFSGGMIPSYLLVRNLGLVDTRWALLIPGALSVYNMIITRTYFEKNVPGELLEASQMDGCNDLRFLLQIVLPVSSPIIAVMALFHAVSHWNAFFNALIYISNSKFYPLQLVLRDLLFLSQLPQAVLDSMMDNEKLTEAITVQELMKYSVIVASSLPVLMIYPFVQKYFVRGILIGSLKG